MFQPARELAWESVYLLSCGGETTLEALTERWRPENPTVAIVSVLITPTGSVETSTGWTRLSTRSSPGANVLPLLLLSLLHGAQHRL